MKQRTEKIRKTIFATLVSIIIVVLALIPQIGFINIGAAAITIIIIPVFVGALYMGRRWGAFFGLLYGVMSLIAAFIYGGANLPFTNPLLSVVPRVLIGYLAGWMKHDVFSKIKPNSRVMPAVSSILTILIVNIVMSVIIVIALYYILKCEFYFHASENPFGQEDTLIKFLVAIVSFNTLIETGITLAVATPIVAVLDHLDNNKAIDDERREAIDEARNEKYSEHQ